MKRVGHRLRNLRSRSHERATRILALAWLPRILRGINAECEEKSSLRLFELAGVLVRLDHVARFVVNANHSRV